jgi:uncharacterized lipoprotein YddW (UPF0748 family)
MFPYFNNIIYFFAFINNSLSRRTLTFLTIFLSLFSLKSLAQNAPKREFRGAWITTVYNTDWPKSTSPEQQRQEFVNILNQHQQTGINAIFVQIRINGDALYPSAIEPWSEWLTGQQGREPSPLYDPLSFMIDEAHKRNMEFHAWFNPYRAVPDVSKASLDAKHIAVRRPDWLLNFGNLRILDPGIPEARAYITSVVMDVLRRYDVDGIHFDDYFYPYPVSGLSINDNNSFSKYNQGGFANRADWRRDNVNQFVKMVSDSIKATKPYVKFGISPFGIWQNKTASQPEGSATGGLQSYTDLYADSRRWASEGWIDYLVPQLYWYIGFSVANYTELVPWWTANTGRTQLYIGQAAYKIGDANWTSASAMPNQIRLNRQYSNVLGSVYYNTSSLNKNTLGFRDSLRNNFYKTPALLPIMPWKEAIAPQAPTNLTATLKDKNVELTWTKPKGNGSELEKVRGYVLYKFDENENIDISRSDRIRSILPESESFIDNNVTKNVVYVVTALNRLHNESKASNLAKASVITATEAEPEPNEPSANPPKLINELNLTIMPNPSSSDVTITYFLPKKQKVLLRIMDLMGKEILTLIEERQRPGEHSIRFNTEDLYAGTYLCTLETDRMSAVKKLVIIR